MFFTTIWRRGKSHFSSVIVKWMVGGIFSSVSTRREDSKIRVAAVACSELFSLRSINCSCLPYAAVHRRANNSKQWHVT